MNVDTPGSDTPAEQHEIDRCDDPLDRWIVYGLIVFLITLTCIPSEWLLAWSMWWNGIK